MPVDGDRVFTVLFRDSELPSFLVHSAGHLMKSLPCLSTSPKQQSGLGADRSGNREQRLVPDLTAAGTHPITAANFAL
jgi:hypothetical protein